MERQLRITFGISEVFAIGSIYLYQTAFTFSMVLLSLALISKLISTASEADAKRKKSEASEKAIVDIVESFSNIIKLKSFGNEKNGYH